MESTREETGKPLWLKQGQMEKPLAGCLQQLDKRQVFCKTQSEKAQEKRYTTNPL